MISPLLAAIAAASAPAGAASAAEADVAPPPLRNAATAHDIRYRDFIFFPPEQSE
jgi:hypothetical protein